MLVVKRARLSLFGATVSALRLLLALASVAALAIKGRLSVGNAAIAVVALRQLSTQLNSVGDAFTTVLGGVTFLRASKISASRSQFGRLLRP